MAMRIRRHRLVGEGGQVIPFIQSPHQSAGIAPRYLILHYTASLTLEAVVEGFLRATSQVSAHLVIGRAGEIVQMVAFNRRAWHAGKSAWDGLEGLNAHAIGIELVNAGQLARHPDGHWVTWAGERIPKREVAVASHRHDGVPRGWHRYPEAQIQATLAVATLLKAHYPIIGILGHEDVSPDRKRDPGPLFPWHRFHPIAPEPGQGGRSPRTS